MSNPNLDAPLRIAIAVSAFNDEITAGLLSGARDRLAEDNISITEEDIVEAPGAFELPLIAQTLARTGRYDGVICLGCVIKGDTAHFEYISASASLGLTIAGLNVERPITFGILTTYTTEQAEARSRDDRANKGREAAEACLRTVAIQRNIRRLTRPGKIQADHKSALTAPWDILAHWPE